MMASMVAGFEVDFAWLLQVVIHETVFKATTTQPFPCMVFKVCRFIAVLMWHIDVIKATPDTVDIVFMRYEANELAPHRQPRPEVKPVGENLEATVEQAQQTNPATYDQINTYPVESISGARNNPRSSLQTTTATLVPFGRVQKLEVQMASLLHHIQPQKQSSISEAKEWIERMMA